MMSGKLITKVVHTNFTMTKSVSKIFIPIKSRKAKYYTNICLSPTFVCETKLKEISNGIYPLMKEKTR